MTKSISRTVNSGYIGGQRCIDIMLSRGEDGVEADKSFFVRLTVTPNDSIMVGNARTEVIIHDGIQNCFYFNFYCHSL